MQAVLQPAPVTTDRPTPTAPTRRTKMLVATVAVASAGALAVNPVTAVPSVSETTRAAVDLAAVTNPLLTLQTTFTNTFTNLALLNTNATTSANAVAAALSNPAVQAQFAGILTAATDPTRILGTLGSLPGYFQRLAAAQAASSAQFQEALGLLPGVLQTSAGFLAQGKFLEAFAEVNLFFLTAGLSDLRGSALDALRVPGDILDSLGLEPLARILGTSWMDQGTAGPGFGRGLLSRAVVGNFGRAVLGAPITAIFQTVEIMDAVRGALQTGDLATAVSELANAPIKIVNAFVNGYVPAFVTDPNSPIPPGPGQSFPGLIGPTGTFDFLFRQIPAEIAAALQVPRPVAAPTIAAGASSAVTARSVAGSGSPSDLPAIDDSSLLTLDTPTPWVPVEPVVEVVEVEPIEIKPVVPSTASTAAEDTAVQPDSGTAESGAAANADGTSGVSVTPGSTSNRPTSSRPATNNRPTSSAGSTTTSSATGGGTTSDGPAATGGALATGGLASGGLASGGSATGAGTASGGGNSGGGESGGGDSSGGGE